MNRRKFLVGTGTVLTAGSLFALYWPRRWKYIVIHHSAGNFGTIEFLQQVHRDRQQGDPIDAIPYHYVVGNGNGLDMGEVASDWRQEYAIWGTHVSANNKARNFFGLGICLIGNFEEQPVPDAQLAALISLVTELRGRYGIARENVLLHGKIDGESTKCPGKYFPFAEFRKAI